MPDINTPISEADKIILNTIKDELFPVLNELKLLVVRVYKCRVLFLFYSSELRRIQSEYEKVSTDFFVVTTKLETPDILFKGLGDNPDNIVSYFRYQKVVSERINEGVKAVEIIDRILDRKTQTIQNSWTHLLAVIAIVASLLSLISK
jgi:hypothetical protein